MTRLFGIIGDPIAQVRSPEVFNRLFRERRVDAVMVPMHVTAADFASTIAGLRSIANLDGLVITVPHKPAAAELLSSGSERVRIAGAANALRPSARGWEGDLFDGEGFALGLAAQGIRVAGKRCAVVGAGGAGASIALALLERSIDALSIWDVDHDKAVRLTERLSAITPIPIDVAAPGLATEIAVNATPLGMQVDDPLPMVVQCLRADACVVAEVIMKPAITRLLSVAQRHGCAIHEGRHMLDSQVLGLWTFFRLPQT